MITVLFESTLFQRRSHNVLPILNPETKEWFKNHIKHRYWIYGVTDIIGDGDAEVYLDQIYSFADASKNSRARQLCWIMWYDDKSVWVAIHFESNADAAAATLNYQTRSINRNTHLILK